MGRKKAPYSIQSFQKISALNTTDALEELRDISHFLVDPSARGPHFSQSPRNILIDWLHALGLKSEDDLFQVLEYYEGAYEVAKTRYDNAKEIFWYEEQLIEKFRSADTSGFTIEGIKMIFQTIRCE